MEGLERVELLADAYEFQRLASNVADRKRRAAARIAIHLRKNDAGDPEPFVKLVSRLHGVLAGHRVGDKQDLGGIQQLLQLLKLLHELIIDMQPSGRVDQQN